MLIGRFPLSAIVEDELCRESRSDQPNTDSNFFGRKRSNQQSPGQSEQRRRPAPRYAVCGTRSLVNTNPSFSEASCIEITEEKGGSCRKNRQGY
jgi:hypothetical protein